MNVKKQIKIGAMLSYLSVFINIASGLIYTPWMIRSIGNSNYGLYTLAMSLIHMFTIDFGLSMATQKYVSKYLAEKDQKNVDRTVGIICKLYLFISIILSLIFLILFFFIGSIYSELSVVEVEKFKGLYIIAAISCIVTFPFIPISGIFSAYEKFIQLKVCDLVHKFATITLTVIALALGYGVYSLVAANLISGIIYVLVRLVLIKKETPLKPDFKFNDFPFLKELFAFSLWTSISSLATQFMLSLQPSILGMVSGTMEIATFGYAHSLHSYIYLFVNAINGFFLPALTRISKKDSPEESGEGILHLMITVGRFILMLYGLMFTGFLALGKDFLTMLLGENYVPSYYCVLLICSYGIIAYPQQIANTYVVVKNKVKKRAVIFSVTFLTSTILSFVLSKSMGAIGCAAAICIALFIQTFLMNILYKRDLGINIKAFFKGCHLKLLPGLAINLLIAIVISKLPLSGWVGFAGKVLGICVVYFVIMWKFMLNNNEKKMVSNIFRRKKTSIKGTGRK